MKISLLSLLLLLALSACPGPVFRPQKVEIPVATPCKVVKPGEPDWNVKKLPADATPAMKLKAVLADLELAKGYIIQLTAAIEGCNA